MSRRSTGLCAVAALLAILGPPARAYQDLDVPGIDRNALLEADSVEIDRSAPLRFAVPATVDVTPQTHGEWSRTEDGGWLWRLAVNAPGATDLNFGFDRFDLTQGAHLMIRDAAGTVRQGPFAARQGKRFFSPVVPGESAVLEVSVPASLRNASAPTLNLHLVQVGRGYRDLFGIDNGPILTKQGTCNVDVACPQADNWRDEIRSVARISIDGAILCSGQLVMDAVASFRPFFLTADHCGIDQSNDDTVVVYWNFEAPTCGALSGGSLSQNQSGTTLRASDALTDLSLVELDAMPSPEFNVFYTGWDRRDFAPQSTVGIHHPSGDEKAISFNEDPLVAPTVCAFFGDETTHWEVDNWEEGTTESGSSGSGIWDAGGSDPYNPTTRRLVGTLQGGLAACGNADPDCYAKFSAQWTGGGDPASRLSDWLDPQGSGKLFVNGGAPGIVPPVPVPTLGVWSLVALALGLALVLVAWRRERAR